MGKQNPETGPGEFILFRIARNFKQLLNAFSLLYGNGNRMGFMNRSWISIFREYHCVIRVFMWYLL